jgi:hypothetical protein
MNKLNKDLQIYILNFLPHAESVNMCKTNKYFNILSKKIGYIKELDIDYDCDEFVYIIDNINKKNINRITFRGFCKMYDEPVVIVNNNNRTNIVTANRTYNKYNGISDIDIFNIFRNNINLFLDTKNFPNLKFIKFFVNEYEQFDKFFGLNFTTNRIKVNNSSVSICINQHDLGSSRLHEIFFTFNS